MGLMKRVLTQANVSERSTLLASSADVAAGEVTESSPSSLRPEIVIRSMLDELDTIQPSLEAPAHVFAVLKRNLVLTKAAILLPDPDERTFVPWSLSGFDVTTQRRLHIPEDSAYSLFPRRTASFLLLSGDELQPVEQYLSVREFSTVRNVVLAPFFHKAKLLAILVIAETPFFALDHTILQVMYSASEDKIASLLFSSRDTRISHIQLPLLFSHDQLPAMAHEALKEHPGEDVTLLLLELSADRAVEGIAAHARETDRYRITQDVTRLVNTMVSGLGSVFLYPEHRLVLLRVEAHGNERHLDVELLLHQMGCRLRDCFSELRTQSIILEHRLLRYPNDSADLEELTGSLM
ncbi:MAG TPA: hypothetical protein VMW73_01385 [Spirochaetia bacterium]|nr:hypothetical protein [Spirochaetia bacterium]